MDREKNEDNYKLLSIQSCTAFLGKKKQQKTYMLPIFFYSHYKNTTATEELKSSVICNKSQLNEGCQIQLTYLFSADTALSNWREKTFF